MLFEARIPQGLAPIAEDIGRSIIRASDKAIETATKKVGREGRTAVQSGLNRRAGFLLTSRVFTDKNKRKYGRVFSRWQRKTKSGSGVEVNFKSTGFTPAPRDMNDGFQDILATHALGATLRKTSGYFVIPVGKRGNVRSIGSLRAIERLERSQAKGKLVLIPTPKGGFIVIDRNVRGSAGRAVAVLTKTVNIPKSVNLAPSFNRAPDILAAELLTQFDAESRRASAR